MSFSVITKAQSHKILCFALLALGLTLLPANTVSAEPETITIGSKGFPENRLLAEIMAQWIEHATDLEVKQRKNLGGTVLVFTALQNGELDLYPEYTGTGWSTLLKEKEIPTSPLESYLKLKDAFEKQFQITWLPPFGFNNNYALAMRKDLAEELQIDNISDIQRHQSSLRAGFSHEFLQREDGYPNLSKHYNLKISATQGIEHGLAYQALLSRKCDIIDIYTTDGKIVGDDIHVLKDDLQFFPVYQAAPIIRTKTLQRFPALKDALYQLSFRIDASKMRRLNQKIETNDGDFTKVAYEFLRTEGLIKTRPGETSFTQIPSVGSPSEKLSHKKQANLSFTDFFSFVFRERGEIKHRIGQHIFLTLLAMLLAISISIPLGIALTRKTKLADLIIGFAGVIQTIPGLALLAFMIPLLGLGAKAAVAALVLYAILPILRNTFTGIRGVDPVLIETAEGIGLTNWQILRHIQLPLAMRTIMAGVRTSTIISIGVATLAAFIGAGGLGEPIITGLQLNNIYLILSGALPAAGLAICIDILLGQIEKRLAPKGVG